MARGVIAPVQRVNRSCGTSSASSTLPATKSTSCSALARGSGGVEAGAGRQHHRTGVVQREQVLQVAPGHGSLPGYHDHRAALLQLDLGRALQQILGQPDRDTGARGRTGRHHDHAAGRVRAAARAGREVAGRPVARRRPGRASPSGPARRAGRPPVRVAERVPGLVEQGQPGRPGDHQVDRLAGVEQAAEDRGGVRRTGGARHPDDPRSAHRYLRPCRSTQVGQREDEQGDADDAVGGEERPVDPGQVARRGRSRARRRTRPR